MLVLPFTFNGKVSGAVSWAAYNASNNTSKTNFITSTTGNQGKARVVSIDSTHALIVYLGASNFLYGVIATMDANGDCTYGTPTAIYSVTVNNSAFDLTLMDSTHAVLETFTNGSTVTCIAFSFTTSGIGTIGSSVNFTLVSGTPSNIRLTSLSATEFYVVFKTSTNSDIFCTYATISGTTITQGTSTKIYNNTGGYDIGGMAITHLTSTKAIINFGIGKTGDGKLLALLVSGSSPAVQDTKTINSNVTGDNYGGVTLATIDTTNVISLYFKGGATDDSNAVVITEASNVLTVNTPITLATQPTAWTTTNSIGGQIVVVSPSWAVYLLRDINTTTVEDSGVIGISGTTLTGYTPQLTTSDTILSQLGIAAMADNRVIVVLADTTTTTGSSFTLKP